MEIYEKRGRWCVLVGSQLRKFATEEEAKTFADIESETEVEVEVESEEE